MGFVVCCPIVLRKDHECLGQLLLSDLCLQVSRQWRQGARNLRKGLRQRKPEIAKMQLSPRMPLQNLVKFYGYRAKPKVPFFWDRNAIQKA